MQDDSHDRAEMNGKDPDDLSREKGDTNQLGKQSNHGKTHKDNNCPQDKNKQPDSNGISPLNIELGIAKKENTPKPLQACTSFRTADTTPNGLAYPSLPEASVEDSTNSSGGNCLQFCRTDHDCSAGQPEVMGVPEHQSVRTRHNAPSGASRCYKAVRLAFLQCLEDTPFVVPGLVLTILFCVTMIVVIAATGRVSQGVNYFIQSFIYFVYP